MSAQPYKVNVNPDSELAAIIETAEAERRPIILEKQGVTYDVVRRADEDIWADYDPKRALQAIEKSAGLLKRAGVDAEQLERDIYADRTQNSSGRPAE